MIKCFGIRFRIHPLFTLLILLSLLTGYFIESITLFGIVLVHELGHVAAIKWYGWRLKEVKLLPFGGVAEVEELGTVSAWEELVVAVAGPAQHLWMIAIAWILKTFGVYDPVWWDYFIEANLMIGLFNMLPILPLDGGKVMQVAISYFIPYYRAIWYGAIVSLAASVVVIGTIIWEMGQGRPQLSMIAVSLFLLYSNWYALKNSPFHFIRFLSSRIERGGDFIHAGTLAQPIVVNKHRQVGEILKLFMREKYHLIYVMNERGVILKVLPEQRLLTAFFHEKKPGSAVSELFM